MKSFLTQSVLTLSYYAGIHKRVRKAQKNTLTILLYHGVAPKVEDGIYNYRKKFILPQQFDAQIRYLKKNYSVIELDKAVDALKNKTPLPPYPLVITFDDGYKNNLTYAAPILEKHGVPATIFVVTNFIDKKIPLWVDKLEYVVGHGKNFVGKTYEEKTHIDDVLRNEYKNIPSIEREERLNTLEEENGVSLLHAQTDLYTPCTWEDIATYKGKRISFGAHTENHPILTQLPLDEARTEIQNSLSVLKQHIPHVSSVFAYPNGQPTDFNEDIKKVAREAGFVAALSTISGANTYDTDMYALKRYTMDGTDSPISFTMKLTGTLDRFRKLFKA